MFLLSGQKGRDAMRTDPTIGVRDQTVLEYRHPRLQRISPYFRCLEGLPDAAAQRPVRWTPLAASLAAVLMSLDIGCTLGVRCRDALACMGVAFTRRRRTGKTYNGLLKALVRQSPAVLAKLKADLRRQALSAMAKVRKVHGWTLLAVDRSKEDLPRKPDLEQGVGGAAHGKGPHALVPAGCEGRPARP